ncbi:MAG TPA: hypothetical protein VG796_06715 [Verrucomicrobiales bacterium]|nr:hypothetical protein [Verrucomicrobiales bacterium]
MPAFRELTADWDALPGSVQYILIALFLASLIGSVVHLTKKRRKEKEHVIARAHRRALKAQGKQERGESN